MTDLIPSDNPAEPSGITSNIDLDSQVRLSPSIAKIILNESPAHAWAAHSKLGKKERKGSASLDKGKVIDRIVFGVGPAIMVTSKGKDDLEVYPAIGPRQEQPIFVTSAVLKEACSCASAVLARLKFEGIEINPDLVQQRWYWESNGNVKCKCIVDLWNGSNVVYDLKSAHDMSNSGIQKAIELYGYDIQAAAELEACTAIHGVRRPVFKWIFVETGPVTDVRIITPTPEQIGYGTRSWLQAGAVWKQCLETDKWPGRGDAELGPSSYRVAREAAKFADMIENMNTNSNQI